jgi:SAM-dependent methyltransferase
VRLDGHDYVDDQYATTGNLATRASVWQPAAPGESAQDRVLGALAAVPHGRVLEVGCGRGELAQRIAAELGSSVIALDLSPAMVAEAAGRGVDARIGDIQALPFADGSFDAVVAAWMLYHVPDLERGLAEVVRVLRPGGRFVAVTNGYDHLAELWHAAGVSPFASGFARENGTELLQQHFARVERIDLEGRAVFADRDAAAAYLTSIGTASDGLPRFDEPLVARGTPTVFVADLP